MLPGLAAWAWFAATPPVQGPVRIEHNATISTHDASRYEGLYGLPIYWSLSLIVGPTGQDPPPPNTSIRTRGILSASPKQGSVPDVKLCEDSMRRCLALATPAPEIHDAFFFDAPFRHGHEAQVVGAFTDQGFLFWSFDSSPRAEGAEGRAPERSLERLITRPDRFVGATVTVRGNFRGANLFGDFPPETRRGKGDWVLRDGPFSIWVTGRPPTGNGWRLDAVSAVDCIWRLEVEGTVEQHDGVLYLKARRLRLLDRDAEDTCARGATP